MGEEVFPWLKSLPLAPEYHPTLTEFQDPISYIFKIEEEASKYGICKIIPPVSGSQKKTIIANLNRSLSSRNPDSSPTFTTRQQKIGFCPRKHLRPVQKSVWQSGEYYTVAQFEARAKNFEKNYLKKTSNSKRGLTALEVETLYWKAHMDKPFTIEYANDMPGSAFDQTVGGDGEAMKQGKKEIGDMMTVGESQWNMQGVSRAKGSLLRFMKEEIPGVTSPMVYIAMLFSWFAWHVEDHDLHSLNYMHMGAAKTWYGIPKDAAVAFEDVVRAHGYGGEINPIVTYATLGKKTIIMSPEVLLKAGVPCCRLVQNAGEFVVTFPRAYHSGFSHGFNCAEAANIATPGWLSVAREAAIRRASINFAPMVSHSQLHYDLALSLSSSIPTSIRPEPRSSRLKDRLKAEGEALVKRLFLQDVMQNNELLHVLGKGCPVAVLSEEDLDDWMSSDSCYQTRVNIQNHESSGSDGVFDLDKRKYFDSPRVQKNETHKSDPASVFSCVSCGVLCYSCVAIVQPSTPAARYLLSANVVDLESSTDREMLKSDSDGLFEVPIKSIVDSSGTTSVSGQQEIDSALKLLALAYGDSEEEDDDDDSNKYLMESNCSMGRFEYEINRKSSLYVNEDSSKKHVFCLHHALEVEQRLRSVGGVHILLLCHQDYPKIDTEARLIAKEFGTDENWTDLGYREVTDYDKAKIQSALDNDETAHGNQDWIVKLGLDIYYSARLSRSPIYTKQMPYNSVIHDAIGYNNSRSTNSTKSGKQKKIIMAGKWCGRVWMSNQVHRLLTVRDLEEHIAPIVNGSNVSVLSERQSSEEVISKKDMEKSPSPPPLLAAGGGGLRRQLRRKRKLPNLIKNAKESDTDSDYEEPPSRRKRRKMKKTKKGDSGIQDFGCDLEGCDMSFESEKDLMVHKRNVCPEEGCGKKFFSHRYLVQHRRVHMDIRPLKCPWVGCSMSFKWAWARTEHVRVHTGARPYQCTECDQTFRFVSDFSRHKRRTGHLVNN